LSENPLESSSHGSVVCGVAPSLSEEDSPNSPPESDVRRGAEVSGDLPESSSEGSALCDAEVLESSPNSPPESDTRRGLEVLEASPTRPPGGVAL